MLAQGYEGRCQCKVRIVATGSTRALVMAEADDVPVAITHALALERDFVSKGQGRSRTEFMENEFVLAGPASDPAAVAGKGLVEALRRIARAQAPFVSRADGSGTNLAEQELWQKALGEQPRPSSWYRQAGVQMAMALQIAGQTDAYTISDSGTLAVLKETGAASIRELARDTPSLRNVYSVVVADSEDELAAGFAKWLRTSEAKKLIEGLKVGSKPVFFALP